jgi:hypothetical protein
MMDLLCSSCHSVTITDKCKTNAHLTMEEDKKKEGATGRLNELGKSEEDIHMVIFDTVVIRPSAVEFRKR